MQIEQKPKDYRAQPLSGEPVFLPGGIKRLGFFALSLLIGLAAAVLTSPIYFFTCYFVTQSCV